MVKAKEGVEIEMLKDEIIQQFRAVRRLGLLMRMICCKPNGHAYRYDYPIFTQVELGGWFIAIFAILVGCFSIANIMFVQESVLELLNTKALCEECLYTYSIFI